MKTDKQHFPVCYALQGGPDFWVCEQKQFDHSNESYSCNELPPSSYMYLLVHLVD